MALPPFGLSGVGRAASALMVVAGVAGVAISLLGDERALAESVLGNPLPDWFLARPGRGWLVIQAVLVIVGGVGLFSSRFSLAAIGIVAGLIFVTPVGLLTMVPVVLALLLTLPHLHTFWEFRPRWRGEGHPPPGPWR